MAVVVFPTPPIPRSPNNPRLPWSPDKGSVCVCVCVCERERERDQYEGENDVMGIDAREGGARERERM